MSRTKGNADRELFNPELIAIVTALNNKCLRQGEIRGFSTGLYLLFILGAREKKDGEWEKERTASSKTQSRGGECQQRVASQVIGGRIFSELVTQNTNTQFRISIKN